MSEEFRLQFKGPQAVLVILALIAIGGFQWVRLGAHFLGGGPTTEIKEWIAGAYRSGELEAALSAAKESMTDHAANAVLAAAAKEQALSKVEIAEMSAREVKKNEYVVRVRFLLGGKPPPDGKGVRYLRVERRTPGGWYVRYETSAFSYYSSFF